MLARLLALILAFGPTAAEAASFGELQQATSRVVGGSPEDMAAAQSVWSDGVAPLSGAVAQPKEQQSRQAELAFRISEGKIGRREPPSPTAKIKSVGKEVGGAILDLASGAAGYAAGWNLGFYLSAGPAASVVAAVGVGMLSMRLVHQARTRGVNPPRKKSAL